MSASTLALPHSGSKTHFPVGCLANHTQNLLYGLPAAYPRGLLSLILLCIYGLEVTGTLCPYIGNFLEETIGDFQIAKIGL